MPKTPKVRVCGVRQEYKYKDWLESSLQSEDDALSYFSFADEFADSEHATNTHYGDILSLLSSNKQTKKLLSIVEAAKSKFRV
jgi:hypothetical protein